MPEDADVTSSIAAAAKATAPLAAVQHALPSQAGRTGGGQPLGPQLPAGSSHAPAGVEGLGDADVTGEVLQRLGDLEALVSGQLDRLSAHHGERVAAIKVLLVTLRSFTSDF